MSQAVSPNGDEELAKDFNTILQFWILAWCFGHYLKESKAANAHILKTVRK